jgi:hypothetical protein
MSFTLSVHKSQSHMLMQEHECEPQKEAYINVIMWREGTQLFNHKSHSGA